jgi:hypothetical protein
LLSIGVYIICVKKSTQERKGDFKLDEMVRVQINWRQKLTGSGGHMVMEKVVIYGKAG